MLPHSGYKKPCQSYSSRDDDGDGNGYPENEGDKYSPGKQKGKMTFKKFRNADIGMRKRTIPSTITTEKK